jgi:hypothetical protein
MGDNMIEAAAKWMLIFYMVSISPDGQERISYDQHDTGYVTLASCQSAGNDALARIDVAPGYNPYAVCVPIDAIDGVQSDAKRIEAED